MTMLIDAEELKEYLEEAYEAGCIDKYYNMRRRTIFDEVLDCVGKQPTVDAVPVRHGNWIRDEFGTRCGVCGLYAYRDKFDQPWESPYCPICGAKMEIERKEE